MLVGQKQTVALTVTGNPMVTCSVSPGSCTVASDDSSASYTGAAPASGGSWSTTMVLTATNAGGSANAKVAISLGQITGVTVSPAAVAVAMNMTQVFTADVTGSGTFPSTVTWTVPPGMGTIGSDGTYTPPQGVQGFEQVTVAATAADGETSGTATVNVGFAWVQYYAPQGMNDAATAETPSSDQKWLVVADYRTTPGSSDTGTSPNDTIVGTAGLLLFNEGTGELEDSGWAGPTPSKIVDMTTAPDGTIYAAGYEYNDSSRTAAVWKVVAGNPLQVTTFAEFQLGGVRTEVHVLQPYNGSIYLAVNSDESVCLSYVGTSCSIGSTGDFIVVLDASGDREPEMALDTASYPNKTSITGMFVSPSYIYTVGDVLDSSGKPTLGIYITHYTFSSGGGVPPVGKTSETPPTEQGASIFQNPAGELLIADTITASSTTPNLFSLDGFDAQFDFNLSGEWIGANGTKLGAAPNPQGGAIEVGACLPAGSTDPTQTAGCVISWPGVQPSGQPLPSIFSQVFGQGYWPGGTSFGLRGVAWDSAGNLYLAGWGTDGRSGCGAAPCQTATVGMFPPPAGS